MQFRDGKQNRSLVTKLATLPASWSLKLIGPNALLNVKTSHVASRNVVATNLPLVKADLTVNQLLIDHAKLVLIGHAKLVLIDHAKLVPIDHATRDPIDHATRDPRAAEMPDVIASNHHAVNQVVDQRATGHVKVGRDQRPDATEPNRHAVSQAVDPKVIVLAKLDQTVVQTATDHAKAVRDQKRDEIELVRPRVVLIAVQMAIVLVKAAHDQRLAVIG